MQTYAEFYESVHLPSFAPPAWVFGVAWGIIYPLITIAFVWLCILVIRKQAPRSLLWLLIANLIANFLFTPIQLGITALWPASIDILIILATLAALEYKVWKYSKLIFWLLVPYLLWGVFATVLQLTITATNPQAPVVIPPGRACTMEAKLCPDGSAVGRTGPNCEFSPCPGGK